MPRKNSTIDTNQELLAKLTASRASAHQFFSPAMQSLLVLSGKTALAAAICYGVAPLFHLHDGYWGSISAIVVLQSNVGSTMSASRDRLFGTLLGALIGFSFGLAGSSIWLYLAGVFTAMLLCGLLKIQASSRLSGVTVTIVMLLEQTGAPARAIALNRVLEVLFGIMIALLVSTLVLPDRAKARLRDGLAQEFLLFSAFFNDVLQNLRKEDKSRSSETYMEGARKDLERSLEANDQLLAAAQHEPAGGRVSRESLAYLTRIGRSLFRALVALEVAARDSGDDRLLAQLNPEFDTLCVGIQADFQNMAADIHRWRFRSAADNKEEELEAQFTALDARMRAAVNNEPPNEADELLRSYAIQLHIRLISRLMLATRIEASQTIGVIHA